MWENVPDGKLDQQMQFPLDCSELYQHSPDLYQNLVNFPADIITLMDRVVSIGRDLSIHCYRKEKHIH